MSFTILIDACAFSFGVGLLDVAVVLCVVLTLNQYFVIFFFSFSFDMIVIV